MVVNKIKEGRKLTSVRFENDHYLANLMAMHKYLGIPVKVAKGLCKGKQGANISLNPPLPIKSSLDLDELIDKLDEYGVIISISIPSK